MTDHDSRLCYFDQIALELNRATARRQLIQLVWIYQHPVDLDALKAFHGRLGSGLMGRLAKRSTLPFERPRWVAWSAPPSQIDIAEKGRPRTELMDWVDEQAKRPIDPEQGPGWVMGVLPMTDGSTAVSVVASHCLVDGGGLMVSVHNAVVGTPADFGYPEPTAATADLRDALREIPQGLRALKALAGVALERRRTRDSGAPGPATPALDDPGLDRVVDIPSVAVTADTAIWDACAARLGGNSYALVAGVAARLAEQMGRRRESDGTVTLVIAGNGRESLDDDRALAMTFASAVIDPRDVTKDLSAARESIRAARGLALQPDPNARLHPLVAWFPKRMATAIAEMMFSYSDSLPSSCSQLGDLPEHLLNADGTPAEHGFARSIDQNVTLRELQRSHGTLVVAAGRINGRIFLAVEAYELGAQNTRDRLRGIVERTLAEFGIDDVIDW